MDYDQSEEKIQRQMQETRASLTEKLETLEKKVVGTVEGATSAVNDTVEAIKDSVQDTVTSVRENVKDGVESVKDLFDMPAHVQQHPWLMVGGSVAAGFVLGTLLTPRAPAPPNNYFPMPAAGADRATSRTSSTSSSQPAQPGMFSAEINKLKGLALGVLFGTAREMLTSAVSENLGEQLKEVVDNFTKKVGGEPLPSSDWNKMMAETAPRESEAEENRTAASAVQPTRTQESGNGHSAPRRW